MLLGASAFRDGSSGRWGRRASPQAAAVSSASGQAAAVKTLVLEGDLHLFEPTPDGELHTVKPAGSFSAGAGGEVHIEGAEENEVIVYFSMKSDTDVVYETLDRDLRLTRSITVQDFHDDWQRHWGSAGERTAAAPARAGESRA